MAMAEKFALKWNDFQTNVSKSFSLFRNESYLHDVTLVSDDFQHIPAHKLVLSASSEYFKRLFQETKQSQPLLCLDGISSFDLENVLDYVYDGEVKIQQDYLDRFLAVAQKMKLEGLMANENEREETAFSNDSTFEEKVQDIGDHGSPMIPSLKPKDQKSRIKATSTTSNSNEIVSTRVNVWAAKPAPRDLIFKCYLW